MELSSSPAPKPDATSLPPGFKGPRGRILVELKRAPGLAAKELSARLSLSLNAIRHHLKELATEGVIRYDREQRGVGAPVFAYRLNQAGEALFPRRYAQTLTDVLDAVVRREGRGAAVAVLESHYADLASRLEAELTDATPEERVEAVTRVLVDEGFMAEWDGSEQGGMLREHNCAILAVAERFPEICAAEGRFLEDVLAAVVDRRSHMLTGCGSCDYHVQFASLGGPAGPAAARASNVNRGPDGLPEETA